MNIPAQSEIAMPEPLSDDAVSGRLEPFRRQRHDEYSCSTDRSADHHHPIGCKLLRQRAHDRHQQNNYNRVDYGKLADGRVEPELANTELRKHIIHLQTDGFEKSDEEEEKKQPVEAGLTDQPPKKMRCVDGALPHRPPNAFPKTRRSPAIAGRLINYRASVIRFRSATEEIDYRKQHDLKREADHEQLLVCSWFKPKQTHSEAQLADVIEYPSRGDIADVHHHVDHRERDRTLSDRGVAPRCRQ